MEKKAVVGIAGVLAAGLALLPAGCTPRLRPVEVEFSRISIEEMERGTVELKITNPNGFSVDIEDLCYSILLTTDTVARGRRRSPVHIEAQDTTSAEFQFVFLLSLADLLSALPDILEDTVVLKLTGRYSLPSFLGPKKRPFAYTRVIRLADELEEIIKPFKGIFESDGWLPERKDK